MSPNHADQRPAEGRRLTVLIVDDQPDVADTAAEILGHFGYDVALAYSASEALDRLNDGQAVDVLFLDIGMRGGMSGLDLALMVRERFARVVILLTTGHGDAAAEARAKSFEVLIKPYFVESLRTALERVVRRPPPG
jgi:CheY-like chemotaxis protein